MATSTPLLSKLVADRQASSRAVAAVFQAHGARAQAGLEALLRPLLAEGETMPDLGLLLSLFARLLASRTEVMVVADMAHAAELGDDQKPRDDRDTRAAALVRLIGTTRAVLTERMGQDFGGKVGVSGATPTDPSKLVNFAPKFIAAVEGYEARASEDPELDAITAFDKARTLAALRSRTADLVASLGDVAREARELQATQLAKDQAVAGHDEAFTIAASFGEHALAAAGLPELAATVRPSGRNPGRTAEPPAESDGTPDTSGSGASVAAGDSPG